MTIFYFYWYRLLKPNIFISLLLRKPANTGLRTFASVTGHTSGYRKNLVCERPPISLTGTAVYLQKSVIKKLQFWGFRGETWDNNSIKTFIYGFIWYILYKYVKNERSGKKNQPNVEKKIYVIFFFCKRDQEDTFKKVSCIPIEYKLSLFSLFWAGHFEIFHKISIL